jgi:hypothetical protein
MRTTVRIEEELLQRLKRDAQAQRVSLTSVVNRTLRAGLSKTTAAPTRRRAWRQRTFDLGGASVDLTKALALAARLEDEEVIQKLQRRK